MDTINFRKYVDHAFCLHYLPDLERYSYICKTLLNIGINIYDSSFFSFVYDTEHKLFTEEYYSMKKKSFECYNKNSAFTGAYMYPDQDRFNYVFYVGLNTYRILKIAQYFNYDRILYFENDVIFLKDIEYIKKALDFVNTQDFDQCLLQTTFEDCYSGNKELLLQAGNVEDLGNDMFLKTNKPIGVYGGSFVIMTKQGINKLIDFYEKNNMLVCLDAFNPLCNALDFNILFAIKPLAIQLAMLDVSPEFFNYMNVNMKPEDYI